MVCCVRLTELSGRVLSLSLSRVFVSCQLEFEFLRSHYFLPIAFSIYTIIEKGLFRSCDVMPNQIHYIILYSIRLEG